MNTVYLLGVVAANVGVITVVSVGIGASAPRWPRKWLVRDRGPLRLTRWDQLATYERLGIRSLGRALPEAGAAFGGKSKRTHPRATAEQLSDYLVEARRGEWVHWLAISAVVPMLAYNPWWMWLAFLASVLLVNGVFIIILRYGRVRGYSKLVALTAEPADA